MISPSTYFDIQTLKKGSNLILKTIQNRYKTQSQRKVSPQIIPGFLRKQIPISPPTHGKQLQQIIQTIQQQILPNQLNWQSPKYFGHFSLAISDTTVLSEMLATAFHNPGCLYFFSPSFTELQNIVVDWCAMALNLPQKFLFKTMGGGIINNSATQSLFTVVHAAKKKKMEDLSILGNDPKVLKFVGYYSEFCHKSAQKAFNLKDIYYQRVVKCHYNQLTKNFQICPKALEKMIIKDIQEGLIPFFYASTYGSTLTSAIDYSEELASVIKKYGLWLNIDAVYLGGSMILPQNQPQSGFFQKADSILINFSKTLLVGNGGNLLFVQNRKQFSDSISKHVQASYYKNQYTRKQEVTDYMDWIVGMDRRMNVLKFYFLFEYYGLQKMKDYIRHTEYKTLYFKAMVEQCPNIFQVFSHKFSLLCFRVKNPLTGLPCNQLTQKVMYLIHNTSSGYSTPGELNEYRFIRLNFGNLHTTEDHLKAYFSQIKQVALNAQQCLRLEGEQ